jgi:hypothetical protein
MSSQHSRDIIEEFSERLPGDVENLQKRMATLITETVANSPDLPEDTSGGTTWYASLAVNGVSLSLNSGQDEVKSAAASLFASYD